MEPPVTDRTPELRLLPALVLQMSAQRALPHVRLSAFRTLEESYKNTEKKRGALLRL